MHTLLSKLFLSLRGWLQWRLLWFMHNKFIIGVAGVILDDQRRILLLRHRYRPPEMMWGLPSGYANSGETLEETLAREVYEETGYQVEVASLLQIKSGFQLRLEAYFLANWRGGELNLDMDEVVDAQFFELDQLPRELPRSQLILLQEVSNHIRPVVICCSGKNS